MGIPYKKWGEMTDALLRFRTNPNPETESELSKMENAVNWPWGADWTQITEWGEIMDRTRAEYEAKVSAAH